jgi:hypothetical protein
MSVNVMDGFGILFSFSVIAGVILGLLRSYYHFKQERSYKMPIMKNRNNGEFEKGDMDKEIDEMPDDSLIYDLFEHNN